MRFDGPPRGALQTHLEVAFQFAKVCLNMNCPNCGLANPDNAKFCANCGTRFTNDSGPWQASNRPQSPQALPGTATGGSSMMKNIGLGCLVVLVILLLIGMSCHRACFRPRRYYRRYVSSSEIFHQFPDFSNSQQFRVRVGHIFMLQPPGSGVGNVDCIQSRS